MTDSVFIFGRHFCETLGKSIGLEDGVPAKSIRCCRLDNLSVAFTNKKLVWLSRSFAHSKDALSVGSLIYFVVFGRYDFDLCIYIRFCLTYSLLYSPYMVKLIQYITYIISLLCFSITSSAGTSIA